VSRMLSYEGRMATNKQKRPITAFGENGFKKTIDAAIEEIKSIYLADEIPWVIGYSGGKDSTAVLQLVWLALSDLESEKRIKPIYVITTDTLVENPVVSAWVKRSLETMKITAEIHGLPITPNMLMPEVLDTFWVNLIGKGYPAPRPKFRWCTERLKIKPANAFITRVVRENGEAILVLGSRKAESSVRAANMEKYESQRTRERLSAASLLPNAFVYTPIENWSNDDVWLFLMQIPNPWGFNNKDLLTMYQGASPDGECPLVVDTTTPSCGDSRFGCWVCTLVDQDRSMHAMIQNDEEKEWMLPLLELRNDLDLKDDRHLRDFRRLSGVVQLLNGRTVHGPYLQEVREDWLRRVLGAQRWVRENGPPHVRDIELISLAELHEIRRIWVVEKHELEDSLPRIYKSVTGQMFPGQRIDDNLVLGADEMVLLREACSNDQLHFELTRELLDVERRYRTFTRRSGLYDALEQSLRRSFYLDEDDATDRAVRHRDALAAARAGDTQAVEAFRTESPEQAPLYQITPRARVNLNRKDNL
jgi:DNA sulfur modification protein DndC